MAQLRQLSLMTFSFSESFNFGGVLYDMLEWFTCFKCVIFNCWHNDYGCLFNGFICIIFASTRFKKVQKKIQQQQSNESSKVEFIR